MAFYILVLLEIITITYANNCVICDCGYELNIVYCYGYEVSVWPMVYPNDWINDVSFI